MSRDITPESAYARELWITLRRLRGLGGTGRLQAMTAEARAIILKPYQYGNSLDIRVGGLQARGFRRPAENVRKAQW